ncbi:hypothetical protein WG66_003133, partial [Moniliophthora roreri]
MLIFHHVHIELIPCAHFFNGTSIWMDIYIQHLTANMGCSEDNLWMSTAGGVLFSGPYGPSAPLPQSYADESIIVPSTVDMLKDDTCIGFFINFGWSVDNNVLQRARRNARSTYLDNLFPAAAEGHQPKDSDHPSWSSTTHPYLRDLWWNSPDHLLMNVIGGLRFDAVYRPSMEAVARWPQGASSLWSWWKCEGLKKETVLDGGLTRLELDLTRGEKVYLEARNAWENFQKEWLLQSSSVFSAVDVTRGKENFFVVDPPFLEMRSTRRPTASRTLRNDEYPVKDTPPAPIYLFLHPLPMSVSELVSWIEGQPYFWSFDETSQSQMSEEECERWGLPMLTPSTRQSDSSVQLYSFPTHIYNTLQDWQKARGFDPATSDWARCMGNPELKIIVDSHQFKQVVDVQGTLGTLVIVLLAYVINYGTYKSSIKASMYVATFLSSIYIDYSAHRTSTTLKVITSSRTNSSIKASMYVATFLSSIYIDYSAHRTSTTLKVLASSCT